MTRAAPPLSADSSEYDLIAIGSGPAGQAAAVEAARLGKRAAIVEREDALGGVSMNAGTLPSQTLRAAILELTGQAQGIYASAHRLKDEITVEDLFWRTQQVIDHERNVIHDRLRRSSVDLLAGSASFVDPHILEVRRAGKSYRTRSEHFVIAVGTTPVRPADLALAHGAVLDSDEILGLGRVPRTLTVIGGGRVGIEYASMAITLGVQVTLVDRRPRILDDVDDQLVEALLYHLRGRGLVLRLGEAVDAVRAANGDGAVISLRGGERLSSEVVLLAGGRQGATGDLNLAAARLAADSRGRIPVGPDNRTAQPHIFAAGDVVSSSRTGVNPAEQGRLATLAALGEPARSSQALLPCAIFTIPELSFVGMGERELLEKAVPFVAGVASYRELVRGKIAGDCSGLLKLLVHPDTRQLLGVHILGTSATELVHLGQTVIAAGLTVDYLGEAVFNEPTYADAYKVAALDACGRLG